MEKVVVQKIKKEFDSRLDVAIKYYTLLFALNNIHITERKLQLIAFTALKGNISSGGKKEEFIQLFHSSRPSIGNMIWELGREGIFTTDEDGKTVVNPAILLDFNKDVILQIKLNGNKSVTKG